VKLCEEAIYRLGQEGETPSAHCEVRTLLQNVAATVVSASGGAGAEVRKLAMMEAEFETLMCIRAGMTVQETLASVGGRHGTSEARKALETVREWPEAQRLLTAQQGVIKWRSLALGGTNAAQTQKPPTALSTPAMQTPPMWGNPTMQQSPGMYQPSGMQQPPGMYQPPSTQQPPGMHQPPGMQQTAATFQPQGGAWGGGAQQMATTGGFGVRVGGGHGGFTQQQQQQQQQQMGQIHGHNGFFGATGAGAGGQMMGGRPRWIVDTPTPVVVGNPQQLVGMHVTMQKRSFHPNRDKPPVDDYVLVAAQGNLPVFLHKETSDQIKAMLGSGAPLPQYVSGVVTAIRAEVAKPRCRYELQPGTTMYLVILAL